MEEKHDNNIQEIMFKRKKKEEDNLKKKKPRHFRIILNIDWKMGVK